MVLKNLLRRQGRTLLTILGIAIGVAAIIVLGALADGLEAGYGNVIGGSDADLVLSDPEAFDIILSSLDEDIGVQLSTMSEVAEVSALLQGLVPTDSSPYFFVFGYPADSFILERFQITEGAPLDSREAEQARGRPVLLGSAAAETMNRSVGDSVQIGDSTFRVVGIYETGDSFEEAGAVLRLQDAQILLGMSRQVSLFYIQLEDPNLADRLRDRIDRLYPDLSLTTTDDLAGRSIATDSIRIVAWGIAALAILIGGVGMMNAQLMAVYERTREIGVLRAVGWKSSRVLLMILGETVLIGILGGLVGTGLAWLSLLMFAGQLSTFGVSGIQLGLLIQAFIVVLALGVTGGVYPAIRASRLQPIEALRYEGGSGGDATRLPIGGMALQNLWRRKARTLLTLAVIGITIGAIVLMEAILVGAVDTVGDFAGSAEIVIRQRDASDTSLAFIDERIGDRIERMPAVENVSGALFTGVVSEDYGLFVMLGYSPRDAGIQRFNVVEGRLISTNREVMVGRAFAEAQDIAIGDLLSLTGTRFRVVGIYESGSAWEELGGVVTLRDAQAFAGRPNKVTFFMVDMVDAAQAQAVVDEINAAYPEAYAALAGDFASDLPDIEATQAITNGIAVMAILVGGVGVMNTMLMAVLERTREIGVLRALGWKGRAVLGLILREAMILGLIGALSGALLAVGLGSGIRMIPSIGEVLPIIWSPAVFMRAILVAFLLTIVGGLYPALRATRMQPVEALRYE
ncbi:MAG: ABC transporter permease [Chloroflexi bacterium]|nr:ABC transporter permease [Chloroflexota bacterium]